MLNPINVTQAPAFKGPGPRPQGGRDPLQGLVTQQEVHELKKSYSPLVKMPLAGSTVDTIVTSGDRNVIEFAKNNKLTFVKLANGGFTDLAKSIIEFALQARYHVQESGLSKLEAKFIDWNKG